MADFWTVKVTWADGFSAQRVVPALYQIGDAILALTGDYMDHGDVERVEAV